MGQKLHHLGPERNDTGPRDTHVRGVRAGPLPGRLYQRSLHITADLYEGLADCVRGRREATPLTHLLISVALAP